MNKRIIFLIMAVGLTLTAATSCKTDKPTDNKTEPYVSDVTPSEENYIPTNSSSELPKSTNQNMIDTMTAAERREVNTYFSNFAEAFFESYGGEKSGDEDFFLINFAFIHNMININDSIEWSNERMGISIDLVNKTLDRFFGINVAPKDAFTTRGIGYTYENGMFWIEAASGESYDYFAIVTDMRSNDDGTLSVIYKEYYAGYDELTKECYSFDEAEAEQKAEYRRSVSATVRPKTYNGKNTYEVIKMEPHQ